MSSVNILTKESDIFKKFRYYFFNMAKVFGPLHSDDARGKLANSMVFMGWKGIKTVRAYITPANPQEEAQGNIRTVIGGLGRAVGKVSVNEDYDVKLKALEVIPAQQSKQSFLVQYIKDNYIAGKGATMTGNYKSILAEFTGATAYTAFQGAGSTCGIANFSLDYDTIATFDKGLGVYLLAKTAIALGFTGSPYTKTLAKWTGAHVDKLVSDMRG